MKGRIERNDGASGGDRSQITGYPSRVVVSQDGKTSAAGELGLIDPPADRLSHPMELRISAAFNMVMTLELECHIVGPALGTFDKAVVERGHGSWGIYTKPAAISRSHLGAGSVEKVGHGPDFLGTGPLY